MKDRRTVAAQSGWRIFRWPIVVALISVIGLLAALVGDGWHDLLSWAALGSTVVLMIAAWRGWSL